MLYTPIIKHGCSSKGQFTPPRQRNYASRFHMSAQVQDTEEALLDYEEEEETEAPADATADEGKK